jgi:unsaturated rhamnogalacturonyl hydrolase
MKISGKKIHEIANKVYTYMISEHPEGSNQLHETVDVNPASWGLTINDWDWNPGVGVTSISAYYNACKRQDVLEYLNGWVQRNKHKARKFQHVNVMTPFAIFPEMYRRTEDKYYLETAIEYGNWIVENSLRTLTGAFQHGQSLVEEIWADTIFMVVLFLSRLGRQINDKGFAAEAAKQLLLHLQLLQDPETGVLFHGYQCQEKNHKSAGRWTRGNAWITVAAPMIISEIQALVAVPPEIRERYQRMVAGLVKYQEENGLWHTIMDRPDFYQESSGSAGIACGILKAIRMSLIDSSYFSVVEKTVTGLLEEKITPEGAVMGVSGGTPILDTIQEYNRLSCYPTMYGQGLTLMLFAEYMSYWNI